MKEETESKCQLCKNVETIDYLTSTCPILAKNEYLMRHKVFAHLHYFLCKALGTDTTKGTHIPKPVYAGRCYSVVESSSKYREVTANRPDIIIINKK